MRELEEGYSDDELTRQRCSLDPLNGIKDVRLSSTNDAWSNAELVHAKNLKNKNSNSFQLPRELSLNLINLLAESRRLADSPLEVYTDHQNRYVIFDDNSSASQTDRLELQK